jgi:hypothetical protein
MAEPQLQPDELDRLEDALEDLELGDLIDDPSPLVRSRLADYRVILMAAREAMPMVDVPPGVLAGVLAEARRADDELLELSAADDAPKQEESWWSRVRKSFLIPSLAVVGTAALILIIVQPTMSDAPSSDDVGVVASVEQAPAKDGVHPPPDPAALPSAAPAPVAPEPEALAEEQAEEDAPLDVIATAKRPGTAPHGAPNADLSDESAVAGGKSADKLAKDDAQEGGAEERKEEAPGSWEAIERGDKARTGGDCFRASNEYHRALDDGNDSVRARAFVGLALCASQDGNPTKADSYFEQARALDPEVGGYIETQRPDAAHKSRKAAPRKKENSKRKAAMPSELQSQGLPGDAVNSTPYKK